MVATAAQKSTIDRAIWWFFHTAEYVAPRPAARVATRMWFTLPPTRGAWPVPEGGEPFEVRSLGSLVRGRSWGDGPVVYLVHGWGGHGNHLAAYVDPLVRRGHRVVMFDAPAHGDSDPGPSGPRSSHGVEFGRALDAVAARFGPAEAVVAHSMGAVPTLLAMTYGWLGAQRLVFLAPMARFTTQFDGFAAQFGIGPRVRRHVEAATERRVGMPVAAFDVAHLAREAGPVPILVVHDRADRQTSYRESVELVAGLPDARLVTTEGLGHHRLLRDSGVVDAVVGFVTGEQRRAVA